MCIEMCSCYRNVDEWHGEYDRIARASAVEHEVLDLLFERRRTASPSAWAFAVLVMLHEDGGDVTDVLTVDRSIFWWTATGEQREARLADRPALRLAA